MNEIRKQRTNVQKTETLNSFKFKENTRKTSNLSKEQINALENDLDNESCVDTIFQRV